MRAKKKNTAEEKELAFLARAARGAQDKYIKEHEKKQAEIKQRWFYAPAYRYTPAEVGGIKHG